MAVGMVSAVSNAMLDVLLACAGLAAPFIAITIIWGLKIREPVWVPVCAIFGAVILAFLLVGRITILRYTPRTSLFGFLGPQHLLYLCFPLVVSGYVIGRTVFAEDTQAFRASSVVGHLGVTCGLLGLAWCFIEAIT